jgi:hypothetical protein
MKKLQIGDFVKFFSSYFDVVNNVYDIVIIRKCLSGDIFTVNSVYNFLPHSRNYYINTSLNDVKLYY